LKPNQQLRAKGFLDFMVSDQETHDKIATFQKKKEQNIKKVKSGTGLNVILVPSFPL
jgi:hypothetical protein